MKLFLLLNTLLVTTRIHGFVPSTNSNAVLTGTFSPSSRVLSSLSMTVDQDSEWYCPPPPPKPTRVSGSQTPLTSVDEFGAFLAGAQENELVLIKFHASWCRSCAKFGRKLDQLAAQYDTEAFLKIGTVEYMEGRKICQALEIEALPTVHMYYRQSNGRLEKVQDFSCPPGEFYKVQDFCKYYMSRRNTTASVEEQEFAEALDRGHAMMETSLKETKKAGKLRSGWKRLVRRVATTTTETA